MGPRPEWEKVPRTLFLVRLNEDLHAIAMPENYPKKNNETGREETL